MVTSFKPWMIWAAIVVAVAAFAGVQTVRLANERTAHADARATHAAVIQTMFEAARLAGEEARAEEQRRTAEVQKAADEAHQAMERARADAAAASTAGDRLRNRIAQLTATCRGGGAGHTGVAGAGETADATADMLADVQRRLDEAANGIARFADQAHAAGAACQRAHGALTP